jgi:oligopeptidase B
MTNKNAVNFQLMEAPVHNTDWENWSTVIAHRDSVLIDTIDVFEDYIVIYEREAGLRQIRIKDLIKNEDYRVDFPEASYAFWPGKNPEFKTNLLRFEYMSLVTPKAVFDFNMSTRVREMKKQYEVRGGYSPDMYRVERIQARAEDGTAIPISLVYRKEIVRDGNAPLVLMGYGAYGWSYDTYFSSNRLSLLDRGFIYAIAHVRGGSEMGKHWHEQAQFLNKRNTFTDFIACIEHLLKEKYTSSHRLVISGGSAGGLLVGAVMNMRPDLFAGVVADVPFVDVINTLLDLSIPLTPVEHSELGDPREEEVYRYMKSYSPYDNVKAQEYPNILITAALNDPRVGYWEPTKWTAKLRALKTDDNLLLLRTNMGAGHEGRSGRYDYLRDLAFEFAFMLDILGLTGLEIRD